MIPNAKDLHRPSAYMFAPREAYYIRCYLGKRIGSFWVIAIVIGMKHGKQIDMHNGFFTISINFYVVVIFAGKSNLKSLLLEELHVHSYRELQSNLQTLTKANQDLRFLFLRC